MKSRGFDPHTFKHGDKYRFMRDGKIINDALRAYVEKVIRAQFDDVTVKTDKLLLAFFEGISNDKKGDIKGFPKAPTSLD